MKRSELKALSLSAMAALLLGACGGAGTPGLPAKASFVPAEGQVSVVTAAPTNLNAYAAARFLDQASWGPTPSSVAEVQSLGIEAWIDKQLALRASVLNAPNYVIDFDDSNKAAQSLAFNWTTKVFMNYRSQVRTNFGLEQHGLCITSLCLARMALPLTG